MKTRIVKISAGVILLTMAVLMLCGLDYLINDDGKKDPVKQEVKVMEKDQYNQYGLASGRELSNQPYYEDEEYIFYYDRILKKSQYKDEHIAYIKRTLENLQSIVPKEASIRLLPIPRRIVWEEGYPEEKRQYTRFMEKLKTAIPDKQDLVDVLPLLKEHNKEYLFFRTSSEWSARGAYYGSQILCERLGIDAISLPGYEEHMYKMYKGSGQQDLEVKYENTELYSKIRAIPEDPFYFYLLPGTKNRAVRFKSDNGREVLDKIQTVSKSRPGTSAFIGGTYQWALAEGDRKSKEKKDKTVMLICDENGQLLVPYLTSYYKQVYVVNVVKNDFSVEEFRNIFNEYHIPDIIFAQSAEYIGDKSKSILMNKIHDITK